MSHIYFHFPLIYINPLLDSINEENSGSFKRSHGVVSFPIFLLFSSKTFSLFKNWFSNRFVQGSLQSLNYSTRREKQIRGVVGVSIYRCNSIKVNWEDPSRVERQVWQVRNNSYMWLPKLIRFSLLKVENETGFLTNYITQSQVNTKDKDSSSESPRVLEKMMKSSSKEIGWAFQKKTKRGMWGKHIGQWCR